MTSPHSRTDIAVVGAGAVGTCTALALQQKGFNVSLFERLVTGTQMTSYGNAGVITHSSVIPLNVSNLWRKLPRLAANLDPGLRIALGYLPRAAPWLARFVRGCNPDSVATRALALERLVAPALDAHRRLSRAAGCEGRLHHSGWLKLYRGEASHRAAAGERRLWDDLGVEYHELEGRALEEYLDHGAKVYARGTLIPNTSYVDDPGALVGAYRRMFVHRGGRLEELAAPALVPTASGFRIAGCPRDFAQAVVCAGPWSLDLLAPLGYRLPMISERGYHQEFLEARPGSVRAPFHDVEAAFVCTPMAGRLRILSGIELDDRDRPPTPRQLTRLLPRAREAVGLGEAQGAPWLGRRPSLPDGMPVLGAAPRHPGLWFGFGHGHIGLSTSAISGEWLAEMVCAGRELDAYRAFSPRRFLTAR
ncbi:NAD(P)/FAD-dependent oxidoreductase [Halotalea alkalilenta]|uniref:NAD(P)/FAD-dependent oxidoreductase n=1 Tax=Halotalea alkalilenta TaxID=376489 RepID=UPI0005BB1278|nr:FAD-dependent oxidoreductase [Halotalea alkalilenta]